MASKELNKKVINNSLILLFGGLFSGLFLFLFNVFMARLLSVKDFGTVLLVVSVFSFFSLAFEFGLGNSTTKFIAEFINRKERLTGIILSSIKLFAFTSMASALLLFILSEFISINVFGNEITFYLELASIAVIFALIIRFCQSLLQGFQAMKHSMILTVINNGLRAFIPIIMVLIGFSVFGAVIGIIIGIAVAGMTSMALVFQFIKGKEMDFSNAIESKKELMGYGLLMYLPFLGIYLMPYLLNIFIGAFINAKEISYFAVSFSTVNLVFLFLMPLSMALLPMASSLCNELNKKSEMKLLGNTFLKYSLTGSLAITVLMALFSSSILSLFYGESYAVAGTVMAVLAVAVFFESIKVVVDPILNAVNKAGIVSRIEAIKFSLIVLFGLFLIPGNGLMGAAITVLIAYVVANSIKLIYFKWMVA